MNPETNVPDPASVLDTSTKVTCRVTLTVPQFKPRTEPSNNPFALPTTTSAALLESAGKALNLPTVDEDVSREWGRTVRESQEALPFGETFRSRFYDEASDFRNSFDTPGGDLYARPTRMKARVNEVLEGDLALSRMVAKLNLGVPFDVCLYATGLWVSIRPPTEAAIVQLYRSVSENLILMGRHTYGMVYANSSALVNERVIKFVIDHIATIHANREEISTENLLEWIRCSDIDTLIWAMGCAMFPQGVPAAIPCVADLERCRAVQQVTLDATTLLQVDQNFLTEPQRQHLLKFRNNTLLTKKDLETYQLNARAMTKRVTVQSDSGVPVTLTLRAPTLIEYFRAGREWIDSMVKTAETALTIKKTENGEKTLRVDDERESEESINEQRNGFVEELTMASYMCQLSHFVDSIEIDTNRVESRKTIESLLATLTQDNTLRKETLEAIKSFIEKSAPAIVGVATFKCPSCGKYQPTDNAMEVYPLGVLNLFFDLIARRIRNVRAR